MNRFFIHMAFEGSQYKGWQVQPGMSTVQGVLESALYTLFGESIAVTGCGRTDTGVHASFFVAHFEMDGSPAERLDTDDAGAVFRINRLLPRDIVIYSIIQVDAALHARFSAISRSYRYDISTRKPLFNRPYVHYIFGDLDVGAMNDCCSVLETNRDFSSFARLHSDVKNHICAVSSARWQETEQGYRFEITADRFLRNMVRAIVGTLLDVGQGKTDQPAFRAIVEAHDRSRAGQSAPARGLFLSEVLYPGYRPPSLPRNTIERRGSSLP